MTHPARPPITFVVDYDGTICFTQVTDVLMEVHGTDPSWVALDERYMRNEIGSREELAQLVAWLPAEREPIVATAAAQLHDTTFPAFVEAVRRHDLEIEVVSDGYGFYVEPALAALGVTDVKIVSAETTWATGRPEITFPAGHPDCLVCGTCKRERVLLHQARGRHVVLVGDGPSDRFAAAHADTIFAKPPLSEWCAELGWPYTAWTSFDEITAWLERIVADPAGLEPRERLDLVCGPEVWGPGRTRPPTPDA